MSTHTFDNADYASSITCTQPHMQPLPLPLPQTVQILCKCKRSNQSKEMDSAIKIRCSEKNCINRIDANGNVDELEWATKYTRYKANSPVNEWCDNNIILLRFSFYWCVSLCIIMNWEILPIMAVKQIYLLPACQSNGSTFVLTLEYMFVRGFWIDLIWFDSIRLNAMISIRCYFYFIFILLLFPCLHRYPDGTVKLRNPHIELMDQDILYHLALGSGSHDLVEMFGDVRVRFMRSIQFSLFICSECTIFVRNKLHPVKMFHCYCFKCRYFIVVFSLSVCLHGWHTETNGKFCAFHNGRNCL